MGYSGEAIKGVTWLGILKVSTRVLAVVKLAILAHILTKADFGVYGITLLVLALFEILTETGINVFLLQEKSEVDEYINTSWVVSIIRGFMIGGLIFLTSRLVVEFFRSPNSYPLLLIISLVPIVRGFINPSIVRFQKELLFRRQFFYKFSVFLIDGFVSVFLAGTTHQVIGIIIGLLVGAIYEVFLSFIIAKPRPKLVFNWSKTKFVLQRGKWITGTGIFDYIYSQGDNATVGRLLGEVPLGVYKNAYTIGTLPLELSNVIYNVTFPIFVKIADDLKRLREAFLKNLFVSSFLVVIFGLFIYLFSYQIVLVVLGEKWLDAVVPLRILSFLGIVRGVEGSFNSLFLALKKQQYVAFLTLIATVGLFIFVIPLTIRYGITGTAISALIGTTIPLPFYLYYTYRIFSKKS